MWCTCGEWIAVRVGSVSTVCSGAGWRGGWGGGQGGWGVVIAVGESSVGERNKVGGAGRRGEELVGSAADGAGVVWGEGRRGRTLKMKINTMLYIHDIHE